METSLISVFAGLSIFLGLLIGLGTLSVIRGIFTFLLFMGLVLAEFLGILGVNPFAAYFLGQILVMGSTYLILRLRFPETLNNVKNEFRFDAAGSCHGQRHFSDTQSDMR